MSRPFAERGTGILADHAALHVVLLMPSWSATSLAVRPHGV